MKKVIFLVSVLVLMSCKKESEESFGKPETPTNETTTEIQKSVDLGAAIFNGKGACIACHKPDVKLIGPSLQDIARIYKEKNGDIVLFLKQEAKPIVDPSKFSLMKSNFAIIEEMDEEELLALEAYIYSHLK